MKRASRQLNATKARPYTPLYLLLFLTVIHGRIRSQHVLDSGSDMSQVKISECPFHHYDASAWRRHYFKRESGCHWHRHCHITTTQNVCCEKKQKNSSSWIAEIKKQVEHLLKWDIIEYSQSTWVSLTGGFSTKKKLNSMIIHDSHLFPG